MNEKKQKTLHVIPSKGTDYIEHVSTPYCSCSPVKEFKDDYAFPLYIHNRLKDNLKH
jgi:hypothetical protein